VCGSAHKGVYFGQALEEAMLPLEEIARLESALKGFTDTAIREVIEIRLEECRSKLGQLSKHQPQQPKVEQRKRPNC
jgi:hypothetical protein